MAECRVSEQALRTAAQTFTDRGTSLTTRSGSIADTTGALTATWTGDAATAYTRVQTAWNTSARDEADSLASVGVALTTMADNFVAVEDAAKDAWPA